MNNITFTCPKCDQSLEAEASMQGETVVCPSCGTSLTVPGEGKRRLTIPKSGLSSTSKPLREPSRHRVVAIALILTLGIGLAIGGIVRHRGGGTSSAGHGLRMGHGGLTKAGWLAKLKENKLSSPAGNRIVQGASRVQFVQIMGKPSYTQAVGEQALWYYVCADGTLQMVMDADALNQMGQIWAEINEY